MALLVQAFGICLADQADQRRAVHVGVGNTGHQIGRARPECSKTNAGLAGKAAIGVGHKGRRLFMAAQYEFDLAVHQRNHHIGVFLARNTEDVRDAFFLKTFYK